MSNPYQATGVPTRLVSNFLIASIAFLFVFSTAALCSLIAPGVAYFIAKAPTYFTMAILRISLATCIPFGIAVGFIAARFATRKTSVLSVLMFLSVFAVIVPLAYSPRTAGPMIDYTTIAFGCTVLSALVIGGLLRRWHRVSVVS